MDQERPEIREIDDARERVASDVRSVARNANVVQRAKETAQGKVDETKAMVGSRVKGARDALLAAAPSATENPLGMMFAGLAIGFLIGMLLPVSRFERDRIGPIAEDVKQRARTAGTEVMRRGGEVIKETIESARESAKTSLREQAKDLGMGSAAPSEQSGRSTNAFE